MTRPRLSGGMLTGETPVDPLENGATETPPLSQLTLLDPPQLSLDTVPPDDGSFHWLATHGPSNHRPH